MTLLSKGDRIVMKFVTRLILCIVSALVLITLGYVIVCYAFNTPTTNEANAMQYSHEYIQVQATVLSKEHKDLEIKSERQWTLGGTRLVPQVVSPEVNHITISYGDLTATIDSLILFNQVDVGSVITVNLHQVYDQNHNLVGQYLELPQ